MSLGTKVLNFFVSGQPYTGSRLGYHSAGILVASSRRLPCLQPLPLRPAPQWANPLD